MIEEFVEQMKKDEEKGLLPKGYTNAIIDQMKGGVANNGESRF